MLDVAALASIADPRERARRANALIEEYQAAIGELARLRRATFDELISDGMTQTEIAALLGMTRSRISQLMSVSGRVPERLLLSSSGSLTIAVPTEQAAYADGDERPVIHREDADFVERITRTAQRLGLTTNVEYVGPGEFIDLNRDGLVVTCGPRQSPWLEQVLTSDDRYGFGRDDSGWYLEDKLSQVMYRSPADSGEPKDLAYLGSLPRPDGQGAWLYAAGIHATGSRGAAEYLERHLSELYQEVKNSLWSCLVSCTYDPASRDLISAELVGPVYRRGALRARRK